MKKGFLCVIFIAIFFLSACYPQKDEMTTYIIGPGSRVQVIFYDHNIRLYPPEQQPDPERDREFLRKFMAGEDEQSQALKKAGAEIRERKVLRDLHPFATLLSAKLNAMELLIDFWKQQSDDATTFTWVEEGGVSRLTVEIVDRSDEPKSSSESKYLHSLTKFVFEGSRISESRGFIVSDNQLSAYVDWNYLIRELKEKKRVTLSLTWAPLAASNPSSQDLRRRGKHVHLLK